MSSPHLLSLPREIRSIIYANLSNSIAFDWGWRMFPFPIGGHEVVRVSVPQAPITNVLLSCKQIYHEYSQERQFRRPVFVIALTGTHIRALPEGKPTNHERVTQILRNTVKVELMILRISLTDPNVVWKTIRGVMKSVETLAPQSEMMEIVVRVPNNSMGARYVTMAVGPGVETDPAADIAGFVACLKDHAQQEYDGDGSVARTYGAQRRRLEADDFLVGQWCLVRTKDGTTDGILVK